MEAGKGSEWEIQFTDFRVPGQWSLSRKLSYKFGLERGS